MKLITIKTEAEISKAAGCPVKVTFVDSTIKELLIGELVIRLDNYSITLCEQRDFEEKPKVRVVAEVPGFGSKTEYFENTYEANTYTRTLPTIAKWAADTVTVRIYENGTIEPLETTSVFESAQSNDDVPF